MNHQTNAVLHLKDKLILTLMFCAAFSFFAAPVSAQIFNLDRDLGDKMNFASLLLPARDHSCLYVADMVYMPESLKVFSEREWCKDRFDAGKADFAKQTVIGWTAGGDCHMSVSLELYRNDTKKVVTLMVNIQYGGCRAAGHRSGIITVDKLPADYHVRIIENGIDRSYGDNKESRVKGIVTWTADGKLVGEKDWEKLQSEAKTVKPQITLPAGTELPILRRASSRRFVCREDAGGLYTDSEFQKILANPECNEAPLLGVDLKKESVLGVTAKGECHMRAETRVFRDDAAKIYNVHVNTIFGECRSYGDLREWLVLEKFRPEYKVQWTNIKTQEDGKVIPESAQMLPTNEIFWDSGCLANRRQGQFDFRSKEAFLAAFTKGPSTEFCLGRYKDIVDYTKHSLIGIGMTTGYCERPRGLAYKAIRNDALKTVTLEVSYLKGGEVCRHMGGYTLWVTVPKFPDGYEVKYEVKPEFLTDKE